MDNEKGIILGFLRNIKRIKYSLGFFGVYNLIEIG